ncbi:MAG TPA: hypothetical protein VKQ30_15805 [Ktedonobacterales bacterium]|nr:hypothetical protein [Ktedonobacterales bacterium]
MPAAAANGRCAATLAKQESRVGKSIEYAGVRHVEDAQRIGEEVTQPRLEERGFAESRGVAPAGPGAECLQARGQFLR